MKRFPCPEGHPLGNITYKMEIKDDDNRTNKRSLVRKMIDDVFYCQACKKFYKLLVVEAEFTPKTKEADGQ